ncbi:MAG: formimidoylglutamase [Bacteroidota bacterium]
MKDISIYLSPRQKSESSISESIAEHIISHTEDFFPDLEKNNIAIISCPEYRKDSQENIEYNDENNFYTYLENLHFGETWQFKIYDLGILKPGNEIKDTYYAINQVVLELIKHDIIPIVIGGSQDLTFPMYQAYQQLEQMVNLTCIDSKFDLGSPDEPLKSDAYISQILMHRPCYLFNAASIGIQAPYVKKSELDLFEKLYFDVCRLGEFNSDFKIAEPLLRNTDLLSLDLNAIRNSDFQSEKNSPNGFYADQICQISKYAGISDKLTSFGIFNVPQTGNKTKNNELIAEIIWYFLDGVSQRKGDFPLGSKKDYTKFIVHLESSKDDITFFKSPKSDRWWMEVPYPNQDNSKYERHHLVPCNYQDYQAAMKNEMPNLWWKTYQKLI